MLFNPTQSHNHVQQRHSFTLSRETYSHASTPSYPAETDNHAQKRHFTTSSKEATITAQQGRHFTSNNREDTVIPNREDTS